MLTDSAQLSQQWCAGLALSARDVGSTESSPANIEQQRKTMLGVIGRFWKNDKDKMFVSVLTEACKIEKNYSIKMRKQEQEL